MVNDSRRVDDELDVVLDGHRQLYRSELGPTVEAATLLAEELRAIQIPPEVAERHIALALDQARRGTTRARRRTLARAMATAVAAAVLVGVPAALVSGRSLPGHVLYPLKRTIEVADLALALDIYSEAEAKVGIAHRRVGELDALLQRHDRTHLLGAVKEVRSAVEAANVAVAKAFREEGTNNQTMALHTQLTDVTKDMMQGLEDVVVAAPTDPAAASTASSILGTATTSAPPSAPTTTSPPQTTTAPQTTSGPPQTTAPPQTTSGPPPQTTTPTTTGTPPTSPPSTSPIASPTSAGGSSNADGGSGTTGP